jgi:hypothetical protein
LIKASKQASITAKGGDALKTMTFDMPDELFDRVKTLSQKNETPMAELARMGLRVIVKAADRKAQPKKGKRG